MYASRTYFFEFLAQVTHYLPAVKKLKKLHLLENFRANVLKEPRRLTELS